MEIPKYIHFCWFGSLPMPRLANDCLKSWEKYMPDHEIILWNESNSPMHLPYMRNAFEMKKWANLSNLTRLYALLQYGGWYFDTDVELIRDPSIYENSKYCVLGIESRPWENKSIVNNAIIWSPKKNEFILNCYNTLLESYDGNEEAHLSSPVLTTNCLNSLGIKIMPGKYKSVHIVSHDVFYPSPWFCIYEDSMKTKKTVGIHHNEASWIKIEDISQNELTTLIKTNAKAKNDLKKLLNGYLSSRQLFIIIYRFIKNKFVK